ncbi:MAG: hypothetical protein VZQ80_04635 [Lachnospiraceae bacterium]|nr:hypothetical protein [Lachnospiraceae bacterium]
MGAFLCIAEDLPGRMPGAWAHSSVLRKICPAHGSIFLYDGRFVSIHCAEAVKFGDNPGLLRKIIPIKLFQNLKPHEKWEHSAVSSAECSHVLLCYTASLRTTGNNLLRKAQIVPLFGYPPVLKFVG